MRIGALFALFVLGCSSSSSDDGKSHFEAGIDAGADVVSELDVVTDASSDAPSAECLALGEKLATALEQARIQTGSRDAALSVSRPGCATTLVRGESGLSPDHLFRIGSITKTYTASVILRLLAAGKLALTDIAEKWVAGLPNGASITVEQLLTHQSGLFNYTKDPGFTSQATKSWTPDELIQISISHGADFTPGAKWSYSNTNYVVLGVIAEKVGQKPLVDQIHGELLAPLALDHTFLDGAESYTDELAPGYWADGSDATHSIDPSAAWAAGAMVARSSDVNRWIRALGSGEVHDAATQAKLVTPVPTGAKGISYGLGVVLFDGSMTSGAGPAIGHDGHINGYDSQAFYFPSTETAIVSVVNQEGASANDISLAAFGVLFP